MLTANDFDGVTEDGPSIATGNVLTGGTDAGDTNPTDGNADPLGADGGRVTVDSSHNLSQSGSIGFSFAGEYGSLLLQDDGTYAYTLDNSLGSVQSLALGQTAPETFVYTVTDSDGDTATANGPSPCRYGVHRSHAPFNRRLEPGGRQAFGDGADVSGVRHSES